MKELATPDFTLAQVIAVVGSVFAVAAAFGLDISQAKQDAIIQLVTVVAPLLLAADAVIRHGRSRALLQAPKGVVADPDSPAPRKKTAATGRRSTRRSR